MRIATLNVQAGARGVDAVAGAVRELNADVACLTEVRGAHRKRIAAIVGGHDAFGATLGWRRFGNMIIAREPLQVLRRVRLSASPGMERRGLLVARAGNLVVAVTHLGLTGEERLRHVDEILRALEPHRTAVLAGDFNEAFDGPAMRLFAGRMTDCFAEAGMGAGETFPSNGPQRRIDYVFARGLGIRSCETVPAAASDHLPVVATFD